MLFEQISYPDDFPIKITIGDIREYPIHYHQDNEFVLVLKGEIALKNGYCTYLLHEGDIFTNAGHEVHRLYASGDEANVVALIQISTHFFSQYYPDLAKACYRTYTNKGRSAKHDILKEKLLQILEQYIVRGFNYKSECIYMMIDVIKFLDKNFNLFTFEENVVVNFESANQLTIDRISRIISYIYQYHADPVTLDDLAASEHLSTFYLSHMIKKYTGMSFREFLCFARAERSEIYLLESDKKISRIAHDVGFSTTAYYEKYFRLWFGLSPEEHRAKNKELVLSETNTPRIVSPDVNSVIALIRSTLSALNSQRPGGSPVNRRKLEITLESDAKPIINTEHHLEISLKREDFDALGYGMFEKLQILRPKKLVVLTRESPDEKDEELMSLLKNAGMDASFAKESEGRENSSFGYDSIAYPLLLLSRMLHTKENAIRLRLRDPGDKDVLIKGYPAALCSCGIPKPVFYAYTTLSQASGDLLLQAREYCVFRGKFKAGTAYLIIVYNYNDGILNLCRAGQTAHNVKNVINEFRDELDLSVNINAERRAYSVWKYSLGRDCGVFPKLAVLNFPEKLPLISHDPFLMTTEPTLESYREEDRTNFSVNFSIKGAGMQLAIVAPSENEPFLRREEAQL